MGRCPHNKRRVGMEKKKFDVEFHGTNLFALVPLLLFVVFCILFFVVFKTFDNVSYALVMNSVKPTMVGYELKHPDATE